MLVLTVFNTNWNCLHVTQSPAENGVAAAAAGTTSPTAPQRKSRRSVGPTMYICVAHKAPWLLPGIHNVPIPFLADRTIGRAFGTVCRLSICLSSVVCNVLYSGETAGPICMKFSGKVWSDHGTTWLHFGSIRVNRAMPRCYFLCQQHYEKTAGPMCMNAPQLLHRSSAMGQYGRPS